MNITEIKKRCEAATDGDWEYGPETKFVGTSFKQGGRASICEAMRDRDGVFIAHARMDLPALVEWARAIRDNLTGILCERDDGAPTERNLKLAELLAQIEDE